MRRYLLDSGILSQFVDRRHPVHSNATELAAIGHRIGTCPPVLAEMHYGIQYSDSPVENMRRLRIARTKLTLWPFTEEAIEEYGRLRAVLRRAGIVMQSNDCMIAAIALTLPRCVLVSADSDMLRVPGLTVENWLA